MADLPASGQITLGGEADFGPDAQFLAAEGQITLDGQVELRTSTDPMYRGEWASQAALDAAPDGKFLDGDWATILRDDSQSQTGFRAVFNGTSWDYSQVFEQGTAQAGEPGQFRLYTDDEVTPLKITDGTDTTFAVDAASGDMDVAGTITLTGDGSYRTSASGSRIELTAGGKDHIDFYTASGLVGDFSAVSVGVEFGKGLTGAVLRIPAGNELHIGDINTAGALRMLYETGVGAYIEFRELSASPTTPSANRVRLYPRDKAGVSNLYWKDDAGVEHDLSAAGGSVATDAIWDAKGDLALGTGADTAIRLAVGTNGQVLTADSAETSGAKWATPSGGAGGDALNVYSWMGM